jgi:hypothetical protein
MVKAISPPNKKKKSNVITKLLCLPSINENIPCRKERSLHPQKPIS